MKKLDFAEEKLNYMGNTYLISRSSTSYEFFHSEFKALPRDLEGNILLNCEQKVNRRNSMKDMLLAIKERLLSEKDTAIGIPVGSAEYLFFKTEYPNQFIEDIEHNIIVPGEEYPKVKVKK